MLFMTTWKIAPEKRVATTDRFLKTGGSPPPGVKMVGRWHSVAGTGVVIAETDDAAALGIWLQEWSDLISFEVTPVVDDAGAAKMLST
jgi:hypothetical protein